MHHILCFVLALLTGAAVYTALTTGEPCFWALAVTVGLTTIKSSIATGEY